MNKRKRPKILVVGSMNIDLIVSADRFPNNGETVIGNSFDTAAGGKGANQAVQAARLGADVTLVGKIGNDIFGQKLIQSAKDSNVDTQYITTDINSSSGIVSIQLETKDNHTENKICVIPGANMLITADDVAFLKTEIINYDMVMLQLEIPMEINVAVAKYAKTHNIPVMLNTAPYCPLSENLLSNITYISPNEHEAALLLGYEITDMLTVQKAINELYNKYSINTLITLGKNGAAYGTKDKFFYKPTVESVKSVDPTAAGDSFVAAFCFALCSGLSYEKALEFGNYVASLTVSKLGAQTSLPTIEEVKAFLLDILGNINGFEDIFG